MNLDNILNNVCSIAKECGQFLITENKNLRQSDIETKSEHDYVTWVDKASEKFLIEALSKVLPEASFVAEESQSQQKRYPLLLDSGPARRNHQLYSRPATIRREHRPY